MSIAILIILHLSLLLDIGMIVIVIRKVQRSQIRMAFLVMLGIMTIWNIGTVLETDFQSYNGMQSAIYIYICYIGICLVPIAILNLGKAILDPDWQPRPVHAIFLIVPLISIVMVFTNSMHHLFFIKLSLNSPEAVYGAYYYFHSIYSYGCIAVGIIFMIIAASRNFGIFSKQFILVAAGIIITLVPNVLYSFGVGDLPFSVSSVASTFSVLCFAVAFLKYRFINTLPITLRQVVDMISDGYLVVDGNMRILAFNKALLRLLPELADVALGLNLRAFAERHLSSIVYEQFLDLQNRAVARREPVISEGYALRGAYVNVEITPVIRNSAYIGSVILFKDVTQNKLAMEATQAASRAKSDFLSHMSHEIRTPLNAIIGMINIGISSDDIEKKNYCLASADSASKHLLRIVNDILDLSKIESEKLELSYSEFDFEKALRNITNMANVLAEKKHQNFIINIDENMPAFIWSDELRLSQIITNLLTNAIKFTPVNGTITLNADILNESKDEMILKVEVADTGIGISKEQQERLFTPFQQAEAGTSQKFGGTGLGLAISKQIVELMGGEIRIESELGKGSKFIFTIRTKRAEGKAHTKLNEFIDKEKINILAVDDSEETRQYFLHIMGGLKLRCDVAPGGLQAIEMVNGAADRPYNIFFVDWQMPDMDGIKLTKRIKEINGENSIVIMISASDWNEVEKEALAAGVRHFISKPLFPSTLIDAINICMGSENSASDAKSKAAPKTRYDFHEHRLLVVEDIEINREIISTILEETAVSIDYAENGKIAVSMFSADPEKYSSILMDINMPEMNGYEATRAIRAIKSEHAKEIPIIAMTANVFKEDIEKCLDSGMDDHIGKPIDVDALLSMLNDYLVNPEKSDKANNVYNLRRGIAWDDSLLTGNELVDAQHQRLFERVSDLVRMCEEGRAVEDLKDTLEFLTEYVVRHFTDEEALQLEYDYPEYEHHVREHEEFKITVRELMRRFQTNGSSVELSKDVNKIIVRWLINHIQQEDKKIGEHIRNVSSSE